MKLITVTFFIGILSTSAVSQWRGLQFDELSQEDGQLAREIYGITQDSIGYIYIATEMGMLRYDGMEFSYYQHDPSDSTSISEGHVYSILSGGTGLIWLGKLGFIESFNPQSNTFIKYRVPEFSGGQALEPPAIRSILEDEDGNLWLGGTYALHKFNISSNKLVSYRPDRLMPRSTWGVHMIRQDKFDEDIIWMGVNSKGLLKFNKRTEEFEHMDCYLTYPYQDDSGLLWSGTWDKGLVQLNPYDRSCEFISLASLFPEIKVNGSVQSSGLFQYQDKLWLAALYGLVEINEEGILKRIFYDNQTGQLSCFYEDRTGNIWIGSTGGKIKILNPRAQHFKYFSLNQFEPTSHYYPSYQIFDKSQNRFLVSAFRRKKIYAIHADPEKSDLNKTIPTDFVVRGYAVDNRGDMWVAGYSELYKLDTEKDQLMKVTKSSLIDAGLSDIDIWQIGTDHFGNLCILGSSGFIYYDVSKDKATPLPWPEESDPNKSPPFFWEYSSDTLGNIWLTHNNYICRFNPINNTFQKFNNIEPNPNHNFRSSVITPDGNLWTIGNTLEIFEIKNDSLVHKEDPNTSDILRGIGGVKMHVDISGRVWIFGQNGLHAIDPKNMEHRNFDLNDGLENMYFDPQQCINLEDGSILTHGHTGILVFQPDSVWAAGQTPDVDVIIKNIRVSGIDYQSKNNLNMVSSIELKPNQDLLEIQYQALVFPKAHHAVYSYKIDGLSEDWIFHGKNTSITLTGLSHGQYEFHVKTGMPQDHTPVKSLGIKVNIPYYLTWWFLSLAFLGIVGLLYSIYQLRIKRIRHDEELKTEFNKKIAEVELQALRAQMNPHFMFNSLNSIKSYILKAGPLEAAEYLTNFATLIRSILHNSREKQVSLQKEIDALLLYIDLEKMRFPDKFDFMYMISEGVPVEDLMIPPLILQPYVENAIWHGLLHKSEKGNLKITLSRSEGMVECIIRDDGIGRAKAMELKKRSARKYKSMGMGITRDRIEIHNRMNELGISVEIIDHKDENNHPTGTSVMISFPIKY